jgi:hypothetical protein
VQFDALKYLTDRRDGKAPQAITEPEIPRSVVVLITSTSPRPDTRTKKPDFASNPASQLCQTALMP